MASTQTRRIANQPLSVAWQQLRSPMVSLASCMVNTVPAWIRSLMWRRYGLWVRVGLVKIYMRQSYLCRTKTHQVKLLRQFASCLHPNFNRNYQMTTSGQIRGKLRTAHLSVWRFALKA